MRTTNRHENHEPNTPRKEAALLARNSFADILDDIAQIFSMLTGTKCRACIKAIELIGDTAYTLTLARDKASRKALYERDIRRWETKNDPVEDNVLDHEGPPYVLINNLPGKKGFKSTSFRVYGPNRDEAESDITWRSRRYERRRWPLPYRSTIVWAIRQPSALDLQFPAEGIVGFLGVDSEARNVFERRWDPQLGLAFADALFHPCLLYSGLQDDETTEFEEEEPAMIQGPPKE